MKIRCVKHSLEKILQQAENFIGKNLDLKILSCVILDANNGVLKIDATNIDISYSAEIPIISELDGKVAILGDILYKTVSAIKDEDISLELVNNILKISSKNSKVEINTLPQDDFPSILKIENQDENDLEKVLTIQTRDFIDGLNSTIYAASKSNIKPELSSIFISGLGEKVSFVATDGFRLAEKEFEYNNDSNEEFSALLPGESISPIIKTLLTFQEKDVKIYFYKNQFFIKTKEFEIFSRLTEGSYVDYKKLIPEDVSTSVIVLKQDFLDSLKLINIFSDDFNQIKIIVKDKSFIMETNNSVGKNEIKIKSATVGDDLDMNFNYKYIQDSFTSIKTDSFEFIFNPTKPLLIKPVGDSSFKYIVMPLSR